MHVQYLKKILFLFIMTSFKFLFQNSSLTWYTSDPDFTKCFEKTVLVIFPIAFFWIFLPLEYYWLNKSLNRNIPWTWKNVSKFLIVTAILVICVCDFFANVSDDMPIVKVDIYMPLVKLLTYVSNILILRLSNVNIFLNCFHQYHTILRNMFQTIFK